MAVQTPEFWKEYELIEETTIYGNKVQIPKKWQNLWAVLKMREGTAQEMIAGSDLHNRPYPSLRWDLLRVYLEVYPNEISEKEKAKEE